MQFVLADDQAAVRSALRLQLEQECCFELVAEAADAAELLAVLAQRPADLLLLDWELPGLPIEQLVPQLRSEHPNLRIAAMSSKPEASHHALAAGANLFLCKCDLPDAWMHALRGLAGPAPSNGTAPPAQSP